MSTVFNDPYDNSINPLTGLTPTSQEQRQELNAQKEDFTQSAKPRRKKKPKVKPIKSSEIDWEKVAQFNTQINPKTGMPLTAAQLKTPELVRQPTQSDPTQTVTRNYKASEYADYTTPYAGLSLEELENRRAEGQAWYEQAGKASARVVVNGALDVVGGLASMIDIEDYANQDDEVGNWLTNLTEEGKQAFNELTPIYRKNPGEAMDVSDSGWWFENGSSLLSSIGSFAAQGYIVGATLGAGSAGLVRNASALVEKLTKAGVTGLTAMGMNQAESIMSAAPVYKENYTKYLQQGMDETRARQKAADDASTVVNINRANVLLNLSSASMFTRSGNQLLSRALLKEPGKLLTKKGIGSLALEGGQEMLEEQINYISEKAGKNNTGLSTGDYLGLNAKRIAQDPHFWEAGALGAIGGIGQTVGSNIVNRKERAKQLEEYMLQQGKIADIESGTGIPVSDFMMNVEKQKEFGVKMRTLETELDQARKDNNEAEVAKISMQINAENSKQLFHQTMTSLNSGTTGVFLDSLKKFNNLTSEEATAKGLPEDYQERTQKAIDFVSSMENTFNEHALKDPNVRNQLVINRGEHHIVKNTINTIQSKIDEQNKKISEVRSLLPTAQQGMSDEALANENATVRDALATKVQLEMEHDGAWNYSNKLDSELDDYLKENYTKRSAKKIKSREEALNDRSRDGFKEMVRMAMMSDPEFGKEELMEIRSTLEGISDNPLQASHMSWLDELIQQQNEFEAGTKQKATLKSNAKDNVVNNSQEIKDALGVDDDTLNKLAAQTHSNEGEMEDADSSPVRSLSDALADAGKAQGPTVLNSLDADDVASLSDDAKSVLSENDMTAQELGSYVNALEEEGTVFNEDEQALIEEHIKQLQAKDELAQKEIEEQLETGTSIDATLSWVLNDATDKTLDPDYKETPDPVKSSDSTVEAGKEAVIKHSNIRPLRPEGAVSTRDSQFISYPIAKPKYQDVDIVFNDKTRGLYVQLLDENGNPIRQSATRATIKLELTEEEKAHAIPVYWNPIKKNPTDKSLIMKKSTEFGFEYVYDRSQITPLRVNGMEGKPLFLVHEDPNNIIYEDEVLDFKSWNSASSNPGVGKKVYLKKGQYVDKEGKQLWVNKDGYKDEVITVHLTPDGPPVQKIESGDTELRREFENLMKDGHVEVEIGFINRGRILNNKNQGKSVEYPISALGELGKDYYLGMGNNDKQIIYTDEMDNSFTHEEALGDVESGRVYAMVRGANGELFPVRLETKNISKDHANKIIDNILLSDNAGTEVQKIMKTVMALDGKKNIEDAEVRRNKTGERMPVDSIFFVNSHSIKIKIGDQIVGMQFGDNVQSYGTYNNLKQALEGKPFKLVQYHSQDKKDANGNHLYGTPVMIDSAKAGKKVPKVISSEELAGDGVEDALNNFREVLVKAIMSRKYQVSKAALASKLEFDSALTGKSYGTYAAYLNDMQIVSTDVSASQLFYGAKADLMPVAVERSVPVVPITATQSTTTIEAQKADIERRREKELNTIATQTVPEPNPTSLIDEVNSNISEEVKSTPNIKAEPDVLTTELTPEQQNDAENIDDFRVAENGFESNPGNILTETELNWILETYGEEHVETIALAKYITIKGVDAYGAYSNGLVRLADMGAKGTAYHEAFHLVYDLALTENQKTTLIANAKKEFKAPTVEELNTLASRYPKFTSDEVETKYYEEQLSEGLREMMEAEESAGRLPKTKFGKAIQKFYDLIRKAILNIRIAGTKLINPDSIYLSSLIIKRQFLGIKTGEFKISEETKKHIKENPTNVTSLRSKKGYSELAKIDILNSLRNVLFTKVIPDMLKQTTGLPKTTEAKNVQDLLLKPEFKADLLTAIDQVKERLQVYVAKNKASNNEANIIAATNVETALMDENWNDTTTDEGFKTLLIKSLKLHGASVRKLRATKDFTEEDWNEYASQLLTFGEEQMDSEGDENETSKERIHDQHFALSNPKKTLSFEVKTALSFIPYGRSAITNLPLFIDFHRVYAMLKGKLADVDTTEMEERLIAIAAFNPEVEAVLKAYNEWSETTKAAFKAAMSGTQLKMSTVIVTGDKFEVIETNRSGLLKQITNEWKLNQNQRKLFTEQKDGSFTVNKDVLQVMGTKYAEMMKITEADDFYNAVNEVFEYVGILFSPDILQTLNKKYPVEVFKKEQIGKYFKPIIESLGYKASTNKLTSSPGADPYVSAEGGKGQLKNIGRIAELIKDLRVDAYAGTFTNGEGKMVYSINLNSYISKFGAKLSTVEGIAQLRDTFKKDVYYYPDGTEVYGSILLETLYKSSKAREEFDIIEFDSMKEGRGAEALTFDTTTDKQTTLSRLALYDNNGNAGATGFGYINMGTKSDKGRLLAMKVPLLNSKHGIELLNKNTGDSFDIARVKQAAVKVLTRNAMQEFFRIKRTEEQLFGDAKLEDYQLIENLHFKGNYDRTKANGLHFLSIPDLNFDQYGLFKMNDNNERRLVNITPALVAKIEEAIGEFVDREIIRGKEAMVEMGVLFKYEDAYYSKELPAFFGPRKSVSGVDSDNIRLVDDRISEYLMNELVWNTEINKYQMGDLALYKTPKNEVKVDNNPEFKGKTGYWYSVVTDAGKRSYQAITPGLDHVIKTMVSGYGKSSTMNMLVVKDIISKVSVKRTLNYMSGLAPGTWDVNPAKLLELAEKIDATKDKTEVSKLKTELTNLLETLTPKQKEAYRIAKGYRDGVNSADAQGYTSLDAHKESMQSRGMWTVGEGETHEQAEIFWRTESDYNKWPDFAKKLVLKPLKTFYFGSKFDPILNMMVFTQIKHATTPLYPAFTKNVPELEVLRNRVEATGEFEGLPKIDVVNLESAVKVGKTSTIEYTSGNSEYLKNPKSVQTIDSANERAPFILPTDSSDDQKDGSQFVKLITADMNDGAEYTTVEGFEKITTKAIKSLNNTLYAEKIRRSADQLAKQLGLDEYYANPHDRQSQLKFLYNLKELLEEQIESRDLPDNYSIALEIQNLETKYSYAMPLSFPAYAKKFEIAMAALYKSRVLTQKLPGGAAVQIAEYGIAENNLKYYRFDAEGNLLPAECAISYKQAEKMGISQYFSKDGEIDLTKVPNADALNIIGYRIPSSAKNSFLPLRVKRLLPPTAKGQIMLPHEIVLQTGADYDVDKMYLYYPEFSKNKEGKFFKSPFKKSLKALHDGKKDVSEFTDKEITNSLFALRWGILTSKHHAAEVMDPLDSSTFANKLAEYTRRGLADDTSTYNFSSFYTGIHLEMINKAAKLLVGLFSSHSVAHAISQDIDIVTEVPIQIEVQGVDGVLYPDSGVSLSKQRGFDGVLISKYISECQNAALDNAKDPLTGSLNITDFTGNVVSYFNRLGYNNEITTDFINQPIIRALSQLRNNSEGFFVSDFAAELIEKLKLPTKHADGKEIQYGKSRTLKLTPASLSNMLGKDLTEMSEDELRDQVQILMDFVEYHGAGSHLAKANKVLAPDRFVKMSGLSDIEIWENNRRFIESGNAKIQISNVYAPDGSGKVNSHPRLDAYHRHAIMGAQNLISVFMPFNESYFTKIKDTIAEMVHQRDGIIDDKTLIETLNNGIYSFELFKSESPISKYFDGTTKEKLTRKFFNSASSFAANVDDYKKKYNLGKNPFLKMISSDSFNSRNTFQMLAFNNAASYSSDTKNTFVDAFEELIKYPERIVKEVYNVNTKKYEAIKPGNKAEAVAEVQALTKNILQYVIYSSGFQSGPNSFIDLVPISFWKSMFQTEAGGASGSLSMYINKFVENTKARFVSTTDNPVDGATEIENQLENTIEQVIRNIYLTPKLLKSVKLQDVPFRDKTEYSVSTKTKGTSLKFPSKFSVNSTKQSGLFTKATEKGKFSGFPKFIKAYDTDNKEWRLYKLESEFIVKGGQKGNATYKLEAPLGETGKFFEVYPTEKNPTSVHPNNNFQVMEAQAPKIAKKETVEKPVTEEVATEIENVPSLSDILPTTAEVSEIAAQLSVSEDIPELEDQGLMDINDLLSQLSATEQEVIKKKMEDGDTNITCGNG